MSYDPGGCGLFPEAQLDELREYGLPWNHRGGTSGSSYGDLLEARKADAEMRELGKKTLREWFLKGERGP